MSESERILAVNESSAKTAPVGAIDQLGHSLSRIIHAFAQTDTDAKTWMMRERKFPNWSIATTGAVFADYSFKTGMRSDSLIFTPNDKSKIAWNFRDLWGIMEIGDIFNCAVG